MSLLTNVHAENKSERRLSVFIFNLIIFVMSFLILTTYATQPFFKVQASATLTKDMVAEYIPLDDESLDVNALVTEDIDLALELVVPAEIILDTAASVLNRIIFYFDTQVDLNDVTVELIDKNIDALVDQLLPTVENLAVNTAKQLVVSKGKDILRSTLGIDNEELENRLADVDLDAAVDNIVTALKADDATTESVAQAVVDAMNDIMGDLEPTDTPSIDTDTLKANVIASLEPYAKEDGSINFNEAIANIFNNMITSVDETAQAESEVVLLADSLNEEQTDEVAELKINIRNMVLGVLGEDVHKTIGDVLKLLSIVLVLSMATWVYLMVKIVAKLFKKDNSVKFRVPILFGGLPGLLWLVPSVIVHFISKNPSAAANPYNLTPSFAASGWLAIMGIVVLIVISAPYSALRNDLKVKKLRKFK